MDLLGISQIPGLLMEWWRDRRQAKIVPKLLSVFSSSPEVCTGIYELAEGEEVNGAQCWRAPPSTGQADASALAGGVMYRGFDGRWILGDEAQAESNDPSNTWASSPENPKGRLPHQLASAWNGADVIVSAVPRQLFVECSGQPSLEGTYEMGSAFVQGMPAWRAVSSEIVLSSTPSGAWVIGCTGAVDAKSHSDKEVIRHPEKHCGKLPHEMSETWQRFNSSGWIYDESCSISDKKKSPPTPAWQQHLLFGGISISKMVGSRLFSKEGWTREDLIFDFQLMVIIFTILIYAQKIYSFGTYAVKGKALAWFQECDMVIVIGHLIKGIVARVRT